ncbi:hypothetical protein [Peribacillus tepidiphilus]|uniref:hypothetical protein n=1 Tax=Peribacillus tepidiphilus TaxID=2652445 RepID=UPI0012924933|nr:hypothetical protein [Peribacillus tepidiphilus]
MKSIRSKKSVVISIFRSSGAKYRSSFRYIGRQEQKSVVISIFRSSASKYQPLTRYFGRPLDFSVVRNKISAVIPYS